MNILTNKTAVITGASNWIGRGIAKRLVNEEEYVLLEVCNKGLLVQPANYLDKAGHSGYLVVPTDVTKRNDVEKLVEMTNETFGEVDIYINNAVAMLSAAINDGKVDEWDQ